MDKKLILRRMLHSKFFMSGAIVVFLVILLAILAPVITRYDPEKAMLGDRLLPPEWFAHGLNGHIFGTDEMGRDIYTRLLYGARYSLVIAFITLALSSAVGIILGIVSGYMGGVVDAVIMRLTEVFMSLPNIVLAITVAAVLGTSIQNLILVLAITGWSTACKIARNNVLVQKDMDYVRAGKVMGSGKWSIMFTEILPNVTTPLIITVSQNLATIVILEASLSFLSLGIQQPTPSWGNMIAGGRMYLTVSPWMPELVYYAKRGYAVVGVQYSTLPYTEFPENLQDVKAAVRFLRKNADELLLDADRIAIMGESAGGYLASICALSNGDRQYDVGQNLDVSSDVQASISWYCGALKQTDIGAKLKSRYKRSDREWIGFDGQFTAGDGKQHVRVDNLPNLLDLINKDTVPFCLLHGTGDELVAAENSEIMYDALQNAGVYTRLYLIKDAGHQDRRFVEESVKARILDFLNTVLA